MTQRRSIAVPHVPRAFHTTAALSVFAGLAAGFAVTADTRSFGLAALSGVVAVVVVALFTKVLTGREHFTWYHYQLLAIATAALVTRSLATLDAFVVGLAAVHAVGRIGCFLTGCCHGRPARLGVRYGDAHVADGFPPHLAGVTLIPLQAIEALAELLLGAWCASDILQGAPAGTALAHYVAGYAAIRFALELLRGDVRRSLRGASEAQGIATLVMIVVAFVTRTPLAIGAAIAMLVVISTRREMIAAERIAHALASLEHSAIAAAGPLRISRGEEVGFAHYTLSSSAVPLTARTARRVASMLRALGGHESAPHVIAGRSGVHHVLFALTEERS